MILEIYHRIFLLYIFCIYFAMNLIMATTRRNNYRSTIVNYILRRMLLLGNHPGIQIRYFISLSSDVDNLRIILRYHKNITIPPHLSQYSYKLRSRITMVETFPNPNPFSQAQYSAICDYFVILNYFLVMPLIY